MMHWLKKHWLPVAGGATGLLFFSQTKATDVGLSAGASGWQTVTNTGMFGGVTVQVYVLGGRIILTKDQNGNISPGTNFWYSTPKSG
jgi:hypothetical protein